MPDQWPRMPPREPSPCALPIDVRRRLDAELVVWFSSVRPDGAPHVLPIWFTWDGHTISVYSKPDAQKVRNVRSNPRVMIGVGRAGPGFDVSLLEGRAEVGEPGSQSAVEAECLARYRRPMAELGIDVDAFLATYSQPIRIVPVRVLEWGAPGWLPATRDPLQSFGAYRPRAEMTARLIVRRRSWTPPIQPMSRGR